MGCLNQNVLRDLIDVCICRDYGGIVGVLARDSKV